MTKLPFFEENYDFDQNYFFGPKLRFFDQKIVFLTKIMIFDQNYDF